MVNTDIEHHREARLFMLAVLIVPKSVAKRCHIQIKQVSVAILNSVRDTRRAVVLAATANQQTRALGYRREQRAYFGNFIGFTLKIFRGFIISNYFCKVKCF